MGGRRAQSSMEYLLVTAFSFVLLVGIMYVAYSQSATFSGDVAAAQVQKVGNQIVDGVNSVYYAGPPTKKTLTVYFPDRMNAVSLQNRSIVFTMQGTGEPYDYAVYAAANMTGTLRPFSGLHTITIVATDGAVNITDG